MSGKKTRWGWMGRTLGRCARARSLRWLVAASAVLGLGALAFALGPGGEAPQERAITILASQYAYDPPVIRVNRGDTLKLRLASHDVVHGFYLEGHDLDVKITPMQSTVEVRRPSRPGEVEQIDEVVVVTEREGKFRYRCSETCGAVHPFMLGELIVGPNRLLPTSLGLVLGLLVGGLVLTTWPEERG